jgi:hypothetical protein
MMASFAAVIPPIVGWESVAPQLSSQVEINGLVVLDGEIYGGTGNAGSLFKWDGVSAWTSIITGGGSDILAMAVMGGEIYGFGETNGELLKWDGVTSWTTVDAGTGFTPNLHGMICVNDATLYAAMSGRLYSSVGGAWTLRAGNTGNGIGPLCYHGGEVYGGTRNGGTQGILYKWDGVSAWAIVAPTITGTPSVWAMISFGGSLYGGMSDGTLQKLVGSAWVQAAADASHGIVTDLVEFDEGLYASTSLGKLLKWDGVSAWTVMAAQLSAQSVLSLCVLDENIFGGTDPLGQLFRTVHA